jgi:hypothetical protein
MSVTEGKHGRLREYLGMQRPSTKHSQCPLPSPIGHQYRRRIPPPYSKRLHMGVHMHITALCSFQGASIQPNDTELYAKYLVPIQARR